jgi:hypothetical protein
MPDVTQTVMVFVVLALTALVIVLGIQVFNILGEFRQSIRKVNKMLDDAGIISESVAKPIAQASGFVSGMKSGLNFFKTFMGEGKEKDKR